MTSTALPVASSEALDIPGASTVASVSIASLSNVDLVFIGSNDGFVYILGGIPSNVPLRYRRVATHNGKTDTDPACIYHAAIQALCVTVSADDSFLTLFVATAPQSTNAATVACYFLHDVANEIRNASVTSDSSARVVVFVEGRRWQLPCTASTVVVPLRLLHHTLLDAYVSAAEPSPMPQQHHVILSAQATDSNLGVAGHLALVTVSRDHPAELLWCSNAATDGDSATGTSGAADSLAWYVAEQARVLQLPPLISLVILDKPKGRAVVCGCVDGTILIASLPPRGSPRDTAFVSLTYVRGTGPIADLLAYQPRCTLPFPTPTKLLQLLEECDHAPHQRSSRVDTFESENSAVCVALDCSGKVLVLVLADTAAVSDTTVTATLLRDYVNLVDVSLQALSAAASTVPPSSHSFADTEESVDSSPHPQQQHSAVAQQPTPLIAARGIVGGIQSKFSFVSNLFKAQIRKQSKSRSAMDRRAVERATSHGRTRSTQGSEDRAITESTFVPPKFSVSPSMGSSFTMIGSTPDGPTANSFGQREQRGALLGTGPVAMCAADVNADGFNELIITTMGRFVAAYRYGGGEDAAAPVLECFEVAEVATPMYFCQPLRMWCGSATRAWIMCGPRHVLVQCSTSAREAMIRRAQVLEHFFTAADSLET